MRPCDDCNNAKESPLWSLYSLGCIYCGARLIQNLQRLGLPADERKARVGKVAADWVAWGHSGPELKRLASGLYPSLPPAPESPTPPASAPRKSR